MGFFDKIFGESKDLAQDSKQNLAHDSTHLQNLAKDLPKDSSHDLRESSVDLAVDSKQNTTKPRKIRKSTANLNIPTPNQSELQKWIGKWSEVGLSQERALNKLFYRTYPRNDDLDDILVKVATLNDFYSTNIYNIFAVARHILGIANIDKRLANGDESLVNEIANVLELGKNFYSFATKFCSHHNESDFAIYDSYVEKMLLYFQKRDRFGDFKSADLRDYGRFKKALNDFKAFYDLDCGLKELDMYLWQAGKKHFAKYGKE